MSSESYVVLVFAAAIVAIVAWLSIIIPEHRAAYIERCRADGYTQTMCEYMSTRATPLFRVDVPQTERNKP